MSKNPNLGTFIVNADSYVGPGACCYCVAMPVVTVVAIVGAYYFMRENRFELNRVSRIPDELNRVSRVPDDDDRCSIIIIRTYSTVVQYVRYSNTS